ncbi:pentapeptide repeat-containing protein [Streptomyces brasiliscabiei]|uniref:pentapeptide repeat-containing protein n=1 Tax=Streptomyces brasiliscabiei TaxID=2736302 RepID=UPI001C10C1C6|nr:pentapeptide repeat-containing protein [Streptomyces brasiliscabiei]
MHFLFRRIFFQRQKQAILSTIAALLTCGALFATLGPISWLVAGETVRKLSGKEKADAINAARQTLLAAIGGTAVLGGLLFTARTYSLSKRGQVTERFSRSISLLAADSLEERLGAVYSLEHVLAESAQDHLAVVNLLANFIRNRTRPPSFPEEFPRPRSNGQPMPAFGVAPDSDIEAALRILAVRPKRPEPFRLDLRHVSLPGIYLRDFEFSSQPSLKSTLFTWADLRSASFQGMDLTNAIFTEADMRKCDLTRTKLDKAALSRVDLRRSRLSGATLVGAFLDGSDLRDCEDLTPEQISGSWLDESTKLPSHLTADEWVLARIATCNSAESYRPVPPATPRPH